MNGSIAPDELLARYITSSRWFRKQDQTVKQDAFMPPEPPLGTPLELSVTRHVNFTEDDIWNIGRGIAIHASRTLYGRADVKTAHVTAQRLSLESKPESDNPNHANIVGWPLDKDARKIRALEIASVADFVANPEGKI
jgi:hypothetical protein